jgi:hypothetical protein
MVLWILQALSMENKMAKSEMNLEKLCKFESELTEEDKRKFLDENENVDNFKFADEELFLKLKNSENKDLLLEYTLLLRDRYKNNILHIAFYKGEERFIEEIFASLETTDHEKMKEFLLLEGPGGVTVIHLAAITSDKWMTKILDTFEDDIPKMKKILTLEDNTGTIPLRSIFDYNPKLTQRVSKYFTNEEVNEILCEKNLLHFVLPTKNNLNAFRYIKHKIEKRKNCEKNRQEAILYQYFYDIDLKLNLFRLRHL